MTELTLAAWNAFLEGQAAPHLLQSGEWGELKSAFGWTPVRLARQGIGAQVLFRRLPLGLTFAYIPKGPVVATHDPDEIRAFWKELDAVCRKHRAVFVKVEQDGWEQSEPAPDLDLPACVPSPQHIQPRSTLVIDLHGTEEEIFERMKPKTRYNIRLAGRKEVSVRVSDDLDAFHQLMTTTSRREGFHVHTLEYYRTAYELFHARGLCELFVAEYQGRTLAALMVFASKGAGYYFYGASGDEERNRKPTYPLQWEAIRWARQHNCLEYDMWGIPDEAASLNDEQAEEREDGLWGVFRFKRGFGGTVRHARRACDRVYNLMLYKLYLWRFSGSGSD